MVAMTRNPRPRPQNQIRRATGQSPARRAPARYPTPRITMRASIHGSSVHSVSARVTVSSGGPWYPDASVAVPMPATLPLPGPGLAAARAGLDGADEQDLDRFGAAFGVAGQEDRDGLVGRVDPQVRGLGRAARGGREVQRVHD